MLYPAFRLGFLVVPKALIPAFEVTKYYADTGCGYLEQATLTGLLTKGTMRGMCAGYAKPVMSGGRR